MRAFYQTSEAPPPKPPPKPPPIHRFERVQLMTPAELEVYRQSGTEPPADVLRARLEERTRAEQAARQAEAPVQASQPDQPGGTAARRQPPAPPRDPGYQVVAAPEAPPRVPQVPEGQAPARPTYTEVSQGIGPLGDFEQVENRMRENARRREEFLAKQEALEGRGIAALEKALQEREAMVAEQRKWDSFDRLRAWFRDLGTRGNSQEVVANGIRVRDEQMIQARLNTENAKILQQRAQQEREAQRFDRADALEQNLFKMENEASKNHIYAAQVSANLASSIYGAEMKTYNDRLLANANMLVEMAKVREMAEQNRQTRISSAITGLQGRMNQAITSANQAVEKRFGTLFTAAALAGQADKPDPKIQEGLRQAAEYQKEQEEKYGIPALKRELEVLTNALAGMRVRQYDSAGQPVGQR